MSSSRAARLARALLWITPALWASNYLIARLANGQLSAHTLALGRWTLALLLMLPWAAPELRRQWPAWRAEWRQLLVLGALGMWVCGAFVYQGGHSTSTTNIGLIYATTPILIAVAGARMLHEPLGGAQRVGVALAAAGVLFIIARGDPANLLAVRFTAGDLWIAAAALSWAAYSVLLKRWPSALSPAARLTAIVAGGVLVLLPATLIELAWLPAPPFGAKGALLIALAALLPGVLAYQAYSLMQRELGVSRTALVMYLSPLYAALGAWWLLGEAPSWYHAVGAALIGPSIWLATRPK